MALASWTQQQVLDQLISGYQWSGSTITYAFPTSSSGIYGSSELSGFVGLNATQQLAAERALQTWDDLIAPDLVRTTATNANIEFGTSSSGVSYAHAYYPSVGSVWFNRGYADLMTPQVGQYGFQVYVHEIGHAFGLDHMGNYNGAGNWTPSCFEDSQVYSIMSYFGPNTGRGSGMVAWADWVGADGRTYSPQTPMLNDVLAIQKAYGAETTTRTGDTVYGFGSNVTGNMAAIFDFTLNANPILTIYDAAGNDTLNLGRWNTNSTINLAPGSFSSCNSMTNNIAIAWSCEIENAVSGGGADQITGNALANRLDGGAGDDRLLGGAGDDILLAGLGNDFLDGGAGNDRVSFSASLVDFTYTYSVNTGFTFASAATGSDTIINVESFAFLDVVLSASELLSGRPLPSQVSVSAMNAEQLEGNSGQTAFVFRVTLNAAASSAQTVDWRVAASGTSPASATNDFVGATSGRVTFAAGETQKTVVITVAADRVAEENETFALVLSNASAGLVLATASAQATITNDDGVVGRSLVGSRAANTLTGAGGDDRLFGLEGSDVLYGSAGDDLLDGGAGADTMYGGAGNDVYVVDHVADIASEENGAGVDRVQSSVSFTLGNGLEELVLTGTASIQGTGNAADNRLTGNSGDNILDGKAGVDIFAGGLGNDTYVLDQQAELANVTELAGQGTDTLNVAFNNDAGAVAIRLQANLANVEHVVISGSGLFDVVGNAAANTLRGNATANQLDGGAGADNMFGGAGNDTYLVDNAADKVWETVSETNRTDTGGQDVVRSSVSWTLGDFVENLVLTGNDNLIGIGNGLANSMVGNFRNNVLDGRGGIDLLDGGEGSDVYVVAAAADHPAAEIVDSGTAGTDEVRFAGASGTLTLFAGDRGIERVVIGSGYGATAVASSASVNVDAAQVGNGLSIVGSGGANILTGTAFVDRIDGGSGNDRLIGGAGSDTLIGGAGNDVYVVDSSDVIIEDATGGTDTVESASSWRLAGNVENLVLLGTGSLSGTGNEGNNTLTGNAGDNLLDGRQGADRLVGGAGNDMYFVDNSSDRVVESVDDRGITDTGGVDTVLSSVNWTLGAFVEHLVLTGTANLNGTGNALANSLRGNSGANVLDGKDEVDLLDGWSGSDIYLINAAREHTASEINDTGASGSDEVRFATTAAETLQLFAGDRGVERVVIGTGQAQNAVTTGTVAANVDASLLGNSLSMLGNAGANTLTGTAFDDLIAGGNGADRLFGGAGADRLLGGAGNDVLNGGLGADRFVFDQAPSASTNRDVIADFATGSDIIELSVAVFRALGVAPGSLTAAQFCAGNGFTRGQDASDRIVYNTATGDLYYDADGSGSGASVAVAVVGVDTHPALNYSDFALIA